MQKLSRDFYSQETEVVAQGLLGKHLVYIDNNDEKIGKIVEVEAYLGQHDLASHSAKGLTMRTKIMYGPPGYAYVYLIYGIYYCFNVVTESENNGCAVLIRALEPIKNITKRTQGPGLLCQAMNINKLLNGKDLLSDSLFITYPQEYSKLAFSIVKRSRIGVEYAKHWSKKLLRFYIKGNEFVSKK